MWRTCSKIENLRCFNITEVNLYKVLKIPIKLINYFLIEKMSKKTKIKNPLDFKTTHFMVPYAGNKRKEVKQLYEEFKKSSNEYTYIVEPFCGTSAFSYYVSLNEPLKYTYVLNDNNKYLIELYKICIEGGDN